MAKSRWAGKHRYCVSAGAPGYGTKIQRCFHKKANAKKLCTVLISAGNRCHVIGGGRGKAKAKGKSHKGLKCCSWRKKCK